MNEVKLVLAASAAVSGPGMFAFFIKDLNVAVPVAVVTNAIFWSLVIIS